MSFSSFFSGEFIIAVVVNPPENKQAKRTSVQFFCANSAKLYAALPKLRYCKVAIPNMSHLEAHAGFVFQIAYERLFDPYVL